MTAHEASFRDPSGFVFIDQGIVRRQINPIYFNTFNALENSTVFKTLHKKGLLIPHTVTSRTATEIIITPEPFTFITYPYEWSFEMYKQAALLTLKIQKYALSKDFILKDASAYNVTYHEGKPIFIDTLSFDSYVEGTPWRAYKQFITHFFGPLVLAKYHGTAIFKMMQSHIDGIPVSLISSLLPTKTKLSPVLQSNIHLLAKMEAKHSTDYKVETVVRTLSRKQQSNILETLYNYINKLNPQEESEWGDYYTKTNYDKAAFDAKTVLLRSWVKDIAPKTAIDIGGNDGTFGRAIMEYVDHLIVTDIDSNAVDQNLRVSQQQDATKMLPFVCDVLQPAPGIGLNNTERTSLVHRLAAYAPDVTLALALIHHMTLSGNVPFERSAQFFASFSSDLIIEFPKREDSWVTSLLDRKREFKDHFDFYNLANFEKGFAVYFDLIKKQEVSGTSRVLYHYKKRDNGQH